MKNMFLWLLLIHTTVYAQTYIAKANNGSDQTSILQSAFNDAAVSTVLINSSDIVINGTLNIPPGKMFRFENGFKLKGKGIINGGNYDAGYQQQIFDASLTVNPRSVNQYFSVKWYGAKGVNTDDYDAIQKSISTCIKNNIHVLYVPAGRYKISQPLIIRDADNSKTGNQRNFCTLEILGESSFWDSNMGSEISASFSNAFAIGIQNGKGCKIRKLKITGLFSPPSSRNSQEFYNLPFEKFKDDKCRDSRYSPYAGIVIDPFTNLPSNPLPPDGGYPTLLDYYGKASKLQTQSGSTGTELEELSISGFVVGICSSPNGQTRNAEITIINKVQFANCKLCISGGQDQEKGNRISNIYCWGGTHTVFGTDLYGGARMAGNWNIDHVNIAGGVVRFIYNDQHGYFPTYISNVFAESLGSFGIFNSQLACEVSDCSFDFAYKSQAGPQTLLTSYGNNVVFRSCNFRYYGSPDSLLMKGNCVFDHCYFSGPIIGR